MQNNGISTISRKNKIDYKVYDSLFTDASWLYEQRQNFLKDPHYIWSQLKPFESRLDKTLDALVCSDESVDLFCISHAFYGDVGDLFTSAFVLAKRHGLSSIQSIISDMDIENSAMRAAIVDAANMALNKEDINTLFNKFYIENTPYMLEMAAKIAGYHRLNVSELLIESLKKLIVIENISTHESLIQSLFTALGQVPYLPDSSSDLNFLEGYIDNGLSDETLQILAIMLLKKKQYSPIKNRVNQLEKHSWLILPVALIGNTTAIPHLLELLNKDKIKQTNQALLALGFLGCPEVCETLIQYLALAEFSKNASMALQLITGADLYEDVFIPDEIDPDELFPDELARYNDGLPIYKEGEEPGVKVRRVSQSINTWRRWLNNNIKNFKHDDRCRFGVSINRSILLDFLKLKNLTNNIYGIMVDEYLLYKQSSLSAAR
jgi:hypothetical protein